MDTLENKVEDSFQNLVLSRLHDNQKLPLVVTSVNGGPIEGHRDDIQEIVDKYLHTEGAILFRNFSSFSTDGFSRFAESFGHPLLNYDFGSTPRVKLQKGVYTATEYPAKSTIPQHNEKSYTTEWPLHLWFHCVQPAAIGGNTPLTDSAEVFRRLSPATRDIFMRKKVMYVRNYSETLDVSWQDTFNTDSKSEVEQFCQQHSIICEWKEDDELRTKQICQAVAKHPVTGDDVWFNQAHLFHVSNLEPAVREALLSFMEEEDLPRNACFGDGTEIDETLLAEIRQVIDDCSINFPWQKGDVLMVDNMLVAHGRQPFEGDRKVIVAMAKPHR